ncbi:nuclear transport factor 2 family protein [Aureisphaera galaxeae]|uniref:nuclear transport factor 2 family protein n=1 Tax=Aureisphaera galaxeae TaxID=1538023 RepID=UPI002350D12B|nr:nuclear transport factor 2 family protein [Aureisphaera galaxeae]MDC8003514.1 nuclear transport factor 2 family protein [Aureisphaera galaxeae]
MRRHYIMVLALLLTSLSLHAQREVSEELKQTFMKKDSILFDEGFNKCNLKLLETQLTDDLEFYHDIGGLSDKQGFMDAMAKNICGNPQRTYKRKLIPETHELFPLYNNGKLYGMIQRGKHEFFEAEKGGTEFRRTGSALFTSLWIKIEDKWLLKRAYSFDHGPN